MVYIKGLQYFGFNFWISNKSRVFFCTWWCVTHEHLNISFNILLNMYFTQFSPFCFPVSGLYRSPSVNEIPGFHHKITNYKVCSHLVSHFSAFTRFLFIFIAYTHKQHARKTDVYLFTVKTKYNELQYKSCQGFLIGINIFLYQYYKII